MKASAVVEDMDFMPIVSKLSDKGLKLSSGSKIAFVDIALAVQETDFGLDEETSWSLGSRTRRTIEDPAEANATVRALLIQCLLSHQ